MPRNFSRNLNRHSDGSAGRYREEDEDSRYAQTSDERAVLESDDEVAQDKNDNTVSEARATQRSRR